LNRRALRSTVLKHSNGFGILDAKLLAALVESSQNPVVGGQISRAQETAAKRGISLKVGRLCTYL
jgi:hypothetical protein